ncbi:RNA 2',3'-cyclic phosphodiesterase [Cellulomonas fimi]|uniref:RNA 2',3'-cyclic phosphodiesterase n=1 Tax=Cellulomonas fimi TaxID=1708 RepID=A0A7Y0LYL2_CELFI|nr:RNA 2',3'-cyclic phosphodiesterase [Cellulomonas fimi]NMR20573.1 RNA 2',3'-cyclic phosphodiesterase [Cellulomonas fimi]
MRLFVAVVPPRPVREHLELALGSVRADAGGDQARGPLRWAPAEDRHVTLAFYGEVSAGAGEELEDGLARVAAARRPFELRLRGAGVFDRRVFWIGCGGDTAALGDLTAACVALGADVTGRTDDRVRSRSHLTVARVRAQSRRRRAGPERRGGPRRGAARHDDGPDDVTSLARALAVYEGPTWTVDEITLIRSRPGEGRAGGPAYDPVAGFGLAAADVAG